MSRQSERFIRPYLQAALLGGVLLLQSFTSPGIADESDCIFEFNKAFTTNQAGLEALDVARQYYSESQYEPAREAFLEAERLFKEAIDQYQSLPEITYDCSPSNLTIAKNNTRTARQNLGIIQESLQGFECLKELTEVENLTTLASDYYHQYDDLTSSKTAAEDAIALIKSIHEKGVCIGRYRNELDTQEQFAQKTVTALQARIKFDTCNQLLGAALASEEQAKMASFSNEQQRTQQAWQEVADKTRKALNTNSCEGIYLSQLKSLDQHAQSKLKNFAEQSASVDTQN